MRMTFAIPTRTLNEEPTKTAAHHLHTYEKPWYTKNGKSDELIGARKAPKVATRGAFLFPYCRQGLTPRLVALVSSVKPFADAVANHTCQNGENKGDELHKTRPPSRASLEEETNRL